MRDQTEKDMEAWAKMYGLKESKGAPCLHWVSNGRCNVAICREGLGSYRWMDHATQWVKQGRRLFLAQPYGLDYEGLFSLAQAVKQFDIECWIHGRGWYGHGTIAIHLTPRGQTHIFEGGSHFDQQDPKITRLSDHR